MSSIPASGLIRTVIDRVTPAVCGDGVFALKRVLGDSVRFTAWVFADSHDKLTVLFRWRRAGSPDWQEQPMRELGNDEWAVELRPEEIGLYEYQVRGWADTFLSWQDGFIKKLEAGAPIEVELQIGAALVHEAATRARGGERKNLETWGAQLADAQGDYLGRIHLAGSHELRALTCAFPNPAFIAESPVHRLLVERHLAVCGAWYEFFPRSCRDDGMTHATFADAARRLPEVARLGFDIVYLPPIHPIGRLHRKGKNNSLTPTPEDVGSPWAIGSTEGGHEAIHPQLGTLDDFRGFIAEARRHNLEVAMDIAFQCAPDHPWVKQHPQWFKWRPDGTCQYAENPPKKYQDILPFHFETPDWENLWKALRDVFLHWIDVGVKVFRVDNPHTKSLAFWNWCILDLKTRHPDVIFLAEAFTRPKRKYWLAKAGYTQGYTYFTWRNNARELREYVTELTQTEVKDYFWPNFWPNTPDILHEDLQKGNRATYLGRYLLAATLSSNVGIYGPSYELLDNEPYPGKEENNNNEKYQLKAWDWNAPGHIKEEIARINRARHENGALQRTSNIRFIETDNPNFIAYLKQTPDRLNQILVVVNMDWQWTQMGHLTLPLEAMGLAPEQPFEVCDLLDPKQPVYAWRGIKNFIKLDPKKSPGHLFQVRF